MEPTPDEAVELESEVILRVPTEAASTLREIIKNDAKEQLSIKLENDIRKGEVIIGNHHLFAKVVNLPTIIEAQKTIDNKTVYKTADICQMIICKENKEFLMSDEEDKTKVFEKKEPYKVDEKYLWPHGLTPPLKNVLKRRFRKIHKKDYADESDIDQEVKYLLKSDSEALSIKWEVVSEAEEENKRKIKEEPIMQGEMRRDIKPKIAERDIFGEALSDSDEETGNINIMDIDEDLSGESVDDSYLSNTNSLMEENYSVFGTQNLVTKFTEEMFLSDDNSQYYLNKEHSMDFILDETVDYSDDIVDDFKHVMEINNDNKVGDAPVLSTLVSVEVGNMSAEGIEKKIDQLRLEVKTLKERKIQQDTDIANIENINLRQRFIDVSNDLLTELLKKQKQIEELQSFLQLHSFEK